MNEGILHFIFGLVRELLDFADTVYVYNDNGIKVSVVSFFVALTIFGIILVSLLNFIRSAPVESVGDIPIPRRSRRRPQQRRYYNPNQLPPAEGRDLLE